MRLLFTLLGTILTVSFTSVTGALLAGKFPIPHTDASNNSWTVFEAERRLGWGTFLVQQIGQVGDWDIFLRDQQTSQVRRLTHHFATDRFPILSPNSQQVVFISWRDLNPEVYVLELDSDELHNISNHPAIDLFPAWSPDGSMLAFVSQRDGNAEIYLWDAAHNLLQNLTRHAAHDTHPKWSSDGTLITFLSDRSGDPEYYTIGISREHIVNLGAS